jgi:Ca2+/H+ antiporter
MNPPKAQTRNAQGSARLKLILFIAIVAIAAYAAYLYVPVAIDAYYFKDSMQNKVNLAAAQGYDSAWLADQIGKSKAEYHVPDDAVISPSQSEGRMQVRVQFTRPISFPGFTYNYNFDYTALSTSFLTPK